MTEYHYALRDSNKLHWIGYIWWKHRKNKLGRILNLDMGEGAFGPGLYIAHTNIIVGSAKIDSFEEEGITIGGVPAKKLK